MHYEGILPGVFLDRPNRFIAHVALDGAPVVCHVKNTGRCRELLVPGAAVYLQECGSPARKTRYDLIAVEKGRLLVNMDAQAPNQVFREWAEQGGFTPGLTLLRPETRWGASRFDFYFEAGTRRGFIEVKGVTLEQEGHARFPDAPTERGVKHLRGLERCVQEGYQAWAVFVIQMEGVRHFSPNWATHPQFGQALIQAQSAGVRLLAMDCHVTETSLAIRAQVPIKL